MSKLIKLNALNMCSFCVLIYLNIPVKKKKEESSKYSEGLLCIFLGGRVMEYET